MIIEIIEQDQEPKGQLQKLLQKSLFPIQGTIRVKFFGKLCVYENYSGTTSKNRSKTQKYRDQIVTRNILWQALPNIYFQQDPVDDYMSYWRVNFLIRNFYTTSKKKIQILWQFIQWGFSLKKIFEGDDLEPLCQDLEIPYSDNPEETDKIHQLILEIISKKLNGDQPNDERQ